VVGAGISGLAAAWELARGGRRVTVLEAAPRVGGAIATWTTAAAGPGSGDEVWRFELGPNTVLEKGEALPALIAGAGLSEERLVAAPAGKRRYLWKGDRLEPLPGGPLGFLRTPLFPPAAKLRLLREPWIGRPTGDPTGEQDESIADFVRRRLGPAFLDYAVGPFVSGVYAGDPERLSVRWAVPRIAALERDHGSLIRGALAKRKGPAPGGAMISFRQGLTALPEALAARLPDVRTGTPCLAIRRLDGPQGGYAVATPGGELTARHLVLAVPADAAAELLAPLSGGASRPLAAIPYAAVVVAALGFRREDVAHPLDGFGFLAPRKESLRLLGGLFPSSLFPGRAPAGHVALSAFAGGRTDEEITTWDDERLLAALLADLDRALGLRGAPVVARLCRWPRAIPQYELGHGRFVELARSLEATLPGLRLAGSYLGGVSLPDCADTGRRVGREILAGNLA
jgi:oxygen-dependent protoporphyrinogen oxidase